MIFQIVRAVIMLSPFLAEREVRQGPRHQDRMRHAVSGKTGEAASERWIVRRQTTLLATLSVLDRHSLTSSRIGFGRQYQGTESQHKEQMESSGARSSATRTAERLIDV
jgi:hypothetical protein